MDHLCDLESVDPFGDIKAELEISLYEHIKTVWCIKVSRVSEINGNGRNNLGTCTNFKDNIYPEANSKA